MSEGVPLPGWWDSHPITASLDNDTPVRSVLDLVAKARDDALDLVGKLSSLVERLESETDTEEETHP